MDNENIEKVQPSELALEAAATAWCKPATEMKVMDPALSTAFAEIIDELQREWEKFTYEQYEVAYQMIVDEHSKVAELKKKNIAQKRIILSLEAKVHELRQELVK